MYGTRAGLPLRGTLLISTSVKIHYARRAQKGEIALQFIELVSRQALVAFAVVMTTCHYAEILASSLFVRLCEFRVGEQAALSFSGFDRARAFLVIVRDMVDAVADWIGAHLSGVEGFQEFRDL